MREATTLFYEYPPRRQCIVARVFIAGTMHSIHIGGSGAASIDMHGSWLDVYWVVVPNSVASVIVGLPLQCPFERLAGRATSARALFQRLIRQFSWNNRVFPYVKRTAPVFSVSWTRESLRVHILQVRQGLRGTAELSN